MAIHSIAQQAQSRSYSLTPSLAASLRVPAIAWPNNRIPAHVIAAEVLDVDLGLTLANYPQLAGDVGIEQLNAIFLDAQLNPPDNYSLPDEVAAQLRVPMIN